MITIEKVLRFVSASTLAATLVFIVVVVFQELAKPTEVLERIKKEKCATFFELNEVPTDETGLKRDEDCVFVPESMREKSDFAAALFKFRRLDGFDPLFSGRKGILLKKRDRSFLEEADFIVKCFRNGECSKDLPNTKRTITATALNSEGKTEISVTYEDELIFSTAKNLKKLFSEIAKIKKLDLTRLRLVLYFHSEYAYLEDKNEKHLISLPKSGIDGLYLKSRGAKIRLLPWEYSSNPLSVLDRKGVQYGLDRDEYKKDAASVYFYRTTQFSENNNSAIPWLDGSSLKKSSYSPLFTLRLISKHLKNIQKEDGSFPAELQTSDAQEKQMKESLLIQACAAEILFKSAEMLEDHSLAEAADKTLFHILSKEEKEEAATAKVEALMRMRNKEIGYQYSFFDFNRTEKAVSSNFIYSGIFIEAYSQVSTDKNKDEKITGLLNKAFSLYKSANIGDKLRFIGYLADFTPEKDSEAYKIMKDFFAGQSAFIKEWAFDSRGFAYEKGTFTTDKNRNFPDSSLSILLADALLKALSNTLLDLETAEIALSSQDFLNKLTVSGDDFPNWGSTKSKTMIQGGVRASNRAKTVKLSNTLRAASYFINRIKREKR